MKSPNETKIKMEEGKKKKERVGDRETDRQIEADRQTDGQTDKKRLITIISIVNILAQRLTGISAGVACDH